MAVLQATLSWNVPTAFAASEPEMREAIETVISMRHPRDNAGWWHRLAGDEPSKLVSILIAMHEAAPSTTYQRLRIVQALGWFDDASAVDFLKKQAKASASDEVVRNAAIRSIGVSRGAKEREFLASFLQNSDADTRFAAASALRKIGATDAASTRLLEQYLAKEKTPWIAPKLRGELPVAVRTPSQLSSSEDNAAHLLAGVWRGFWLNPATRPQVGLASEAATLDAKVRVEDSTLTASLTLLSNGKGRIFRLDGVSRKGNAVRGTLKHSEPGAEALVFTGEISGDEADRQLEIKVPARRVTVVLRRDP